MTSKADLRALLLARRRARSEAERSAAADAIAQQAAAVGLISRARRVAIYLSMPSEPGTGPLIEMFAALGTELVAPVIGPDHALDWATLSPGASTVQASIGMPEPIGPRLGAAALAACDLVLLPALAVDHAGHRLGRGAGYYDRALAGIRAPLCAVVFAGELLPEVPSDPHDVSVQMALTPHGLFRVPGQPGREARSGWIQ